MVPQGHCRQQRKPRSLLSWEQKRGKIKLSFLPPCSPGMAPRHKSRSVGLSGPCTPRPRAHRGHKRWKEMSPAPLHSLLSGMLPPGWGQGSRINSRGRGGAKRREVAFIMSSPSWELPLTHRPHYRPLITLICREGATVPPPRASSGAARWLQVRVRPGPDCCPSSRSHQSHA